MFKDGFDPLGGRINRTTYFVAQIILACIWLPFIGMIGLTEIFGSAAELDAFLVAWYAVLGACSVVLGVKRFHDADMSGWWILLLLMFTALVPMMLCFLGGTKGDNRFGREPQPGIAF